MVIPVLMFIVALIFPFWIYGTNGRYELSSILLGISIDLSEAAVSVQLIPEPRFLLPALLICIPCFLWLYMEHDLKFSGRLVSAGLLTLLVIAILLLFLPVWAVFPWLFEVVIAIVPDYINLISFSGLAFTTMILLPIIWRVLIYPETEVLAPGKRLAAVVLTISSLLLPITFETSRWQGTDINHNFFEGFSLDAATWSLNNRLDGNLWGQNTWFSFSMSSIFACLSLILLILPGIIFARFVIRGTFERGRISPMLVAGLTHVLIVSIACIWWNYTASYPGSWVIVPFPALLIVGFLIFGISYIYQKRNTKNLRNQPELILTNEPLP